MCACTSIRPRALVPRTAPHAPSRRSTRVGARPATAGFTLVELLIVLVLLVVAIGLSAPPLLRATTRLRLRTAATEVMRALTIARRAAVRHGANVGLKLYTADAERGGPISWTLYRDGDGDGVRTQDVERGVDPLLDSSARHAPRGGLFGGGVHFGFPPDVVPRDPTTGRRIDRLSDPIRFNRSDIAAFSPLGTATPGSVYLTDGRSGLAVVRVTGVTGRIRLLLYDPEDESWR